MTRIDRAASWTPLSKNYSGSALVLASALTLACGGTNGSVSGDGDATSKEDGVPSDEDLDAGNTGGGPSSGGDVPGTGDASGGDGNDSTETSCESGLTACSQTCTDTTTDLANCGACGRACQAETTCQEGECVAGGNYVPWEVAAANSYASVATTPDGLTISEEVHTFLSDQANRSVAADEEMVGGINLEAGKLVLTESLVDNDAKSVWHTHLWNTSYSAYDMGSWLGGQSYQFETVRGVANITYVALRTDQTPTDLTHAMIEAEADELRDDIGAVMDDKEASHWAVFELSRRYNFAYYFAGPNSTLLLRVTTEGPSNVAAPAGYPVGILGAFRTEPPVDVPEE